jgi:hypothetical protein
LTKVRYLQWYNKARVTTKTKQPDSQRDARKNLYYWLCKKYAGAGLYRRGGDHSKKCHHQLLKAGVKKSMTAGKKHLGHARVIQVLPTSRSGWKETKHI